MSAAQDWWRAPQWWEMPANEAGRQIGNVDTIVCCMMEMREQIKELEARVAELERRVGE